MNHDTPRIPIINLRKNLIVSLQGSPTDGMVAQLQTDLGARIQEANPKGLVLDVSGMGILDSYVSKALRDLAVMSRLMGVHAVICGMHPLMALTLVEMGLRLDDVPHKMNLEQALDYLAELEQSRLAHDLVELEDTLEDASAAPGEPEARPEDTPARS